MSLKEIEVTTEDCCQCGSSNIKLYTPNDETENEHFFTVCLDCKGETIVVPTQDEFFIKKKGITCNEKLGNYAKKLAEKDLWNHFLDMIISIESRRFPDRNLKPIPRPQLIFRSN